MRITLGQRGDAPIAGTDADRGKAAVAELVEDNDLKALLLGMSVGLRKRSLSEGIPQYSL
jgi:hypothetical protein